MSEGKHVTNNINEPRKGDDDYKYNYVMVMSPHHKLNHNSQVS